MKFLRKTKENVENTTLIEILLANERKKKNWDYFDLAKKINDTNINEKTVKKWEYGLLYPNLETIYKLSDIYDIPSEELIQARNNSLNYGYKNIRFKFIDWLCYIANFSIITSIIINFLLIYIIAPSYAFWFFYQCAQKAISEM